MTYIVLGGALNSAQYPLHSTERTHDNAHTVTVSHS